MEARKICWRENILRRWSGLMIGCIIWPYRLRQKIVPVQIRLQLSTRCVYEIILLRTKTRQNGLSFVRLTSRIASYQSKKSVKYHRSLSTLYTTEKRTLMIWVDIEMIWSSCKRYALVKETRSSSKQITRICICSSYLLGWHLQTQNKTSSMGQIE